MVAKATGTVNDSPLGRLARFLNVPVERLQFDYLVAALPLDTFANLRAYRTSSFKLARILRGESEPPGAEIFEEMFLRELKNGTPRPRIETTCHEYSEPAEHRLQSEREAKKRASKGFVIEYTDRVVNEHQEEIASIIEDILGRIENLEGQRGQKGAR
jgi:hypothetical protein